MTPPAPAAVVGYDDQGAFLGVSQDAYHGGKWSARAASSTPVPGDYGGLPGPVLPAVDPLIVVALAVLLAILLLQDGGDDGGDSTWISAAPPPAPPPVVTFGDDPGPNPVPPGTPELPPVTAIPIAPALPFLLGAVVALSLAARRKR
ncbi:hypothetical protein Dshi_1786 [Dinoroseobacter shibae DFL 12 = DSM 16493]|jgi:hypothetical protein|uniref:Uncharacterized protein n=1 Tax=Dinoroseobacter shibae (strain DSM 16493 / NCIMB 14021 / DFL 12) TaxID=398580 RepID=A8LMI3_DINSH|nr:hypothetical protein [Dinoroseobacter shibae]ABV93528.1 hypothetical protein Dshi_1786 [Dinoroseobacter shibae DFL 12 = DSM 16493]URF48439.1 hypothetical protein M8008_09225 [Dinoroseobacter shibae]URF52749.1 hypothetical protein M8007_09225 [Dinoroseobacter shibae]